MRGSKLLLEEHPLVVIPELAKKIGLNEAIILQQVHYWVVLNSKKERNYRDDYYWTYNTFKEWQLQFPFWSVRTIKTIVSNLERLGLLIPANYNKLRQDRTKWYRVDYDACTLQSADVALSTDVSCTMDSADVAPPLPETTSETIPETTTYKGKLHFGEFKNVLLKLEEYEKLVNSFGEKDALKLIENLSGYMESAGKKYKSHYATILNWRRRDLKENGKFVDPRDDPNKYTKGKLGHMVRS